MKLPYRLWIAAGGLCICCAKKMPHMGQGNPVTNAPTVEHVFPRHPRACSLKKCRDLESLFDLPNKKAMAHAICNRKKGNRAPKPCEVIFLMALNARIGHTAQNDSKPGAQMRTAARSARRKRKRMHEMQEMNS